MTHEEEDHGKQDVTPAAEGVAGHPDGGEFAKAPGEVTGGVTSCSTEEEPRVEGFPVSTALSPALVLAARWRRFCEVHERDLGIPADMTAVCLTGCMAGLNAGHVVGEINGIEVLPNLYTLVSGPRGGFKSLCWKLVAKPLFEVQSTATAEAQDEWETRIRPDIIGCEEEIRQAYKELRKVPNDRSIAERIATFESAKAGFERLRSGRERFILDDSTAPSRNRAILRAKRNAIFQCSAEARPHLMALLGGSGRGRENEIHLFLTAFGGEPLSLDRVAGDLAATADSVIMSVLFAVQNDLAARFFADPILGQSGLLSRFLGFAFHGGGGEGGKKVVGKSGGHRNVGGMEVPCGCVVRVQEGQRALRNAEDSVLRRRDPVASRIGATLSGRRS